MAKLAPLYYRPDFGQAQAEALFEAFVEDLADFAICDIEESIRAYRRETKNKFFPTPGQLRELAAKAAKERVEKARPRRALPTDPRPNLWWFLPFWKPHWRETDIPIEEIRAYELRKQHKGEPRIMA